MFFGFYGFSRDFLGVFKGFLGCSQGFSRCQAGGLQMFRVGGAFDRGGVRFSPVRAGDGG